MEKITNIEIKNFKSIRHQKIDGCKRINVFIGYPNVGKSNILEALSLLAYAKDLRQDEKTLNLKALCRYEDVAELFFDTDINKDIELFFKDYVITLRYISVNELDFGVTPASTHVERYNISDSNLLSNVKIDKDGNLIPMSTPITEIFKFSVKKYQLKLNEFDKKSNPTQLVFPNGSNLFEVIRYNSELRKEVGKLFDIYSLKLIFDKDNSIKIQKQLDEFTAYQLPFSQIADTLQRLIFYKAAILSNQNSVLLFEEPEAHMFPPYIKELTSDIIFDKNDNQYFIATHSPFVLNELIEEAQEELSVYVVDYNKGETIIKRLTDEEVTEISQYGIDLFFNLESYLEKNGQPHSA